MAAHPPAQARGYSYEDCITCTPACLPDFEAKLKMFYQEHLHTDEEIRYVLDGSGAWHPRPPRQKGVPACLGAALHAPAP